MRDDYKLPEGAVAVPGTLYVPDGGLPAKSYGHLTAEGELVLFNEGGYNRQIVAASPGLTSGEIVRAVLKANPGAKMMSVYPTIYRLRGVQIFEREGRYYAK